MSKLNIKRAIENIRANTTVYTPVVEMIVNAIQAIEECNRQDGKVSVRALRSSQTELDGSLPDVTGFLIEDNGVGFTDEHRNSFDTLYTDHRIAEGGKGFGRFTCLKYFEDLQGRLSQITFQLDQECEDFHLISLTIWRTPASMEPLFHVQNLHQHSGSAFPPVLRQRIARESSHGQWQGFQPAGKWDWEVQQSFSWYYLIAYVVVRFVDIRRAGDVDTHLLLYSIESITFRSIYW